MSSGHRLAVLALLLNALTWGLSWWPLRRLEAAGLHALWATALVYTIAVGAILAWRPGAGAALWRERRLWLLVLAAGGTNAAFNWAVTLGDVVRVVLLFYLMPLWAVLLARLILREPLTGAAAARVMLALGGALVVLWPAGGGWPLPRSVPDALGLLGGFCFALNNVLLRRDADTPESARALAMFGGGAVVSAVVGALGVAGGVVPAPPLSPGEVLPMVLLLAAAFLAGNLALQYGAARLAAHTTAAVMVSEVLFASVSSVALGAATLSAPLLLGGAMIVAAALLAALRG